MSGSFAEIEFGPVLVAGFFSLFLTTAFLFAPTLVIDRRMAFHEAIGHSFRCTLRDPIGIGLFFFVWVLAGLLVEILKVVFFCVPFLPTIIGGACVPALWTVRMLAHRAYFGLGPDWVLEEELKERGYYDMMAQQAAERSERTGQGAPHGPQ